ncbi:MAG: alpha/beta hydrolase [Legionellaceae bacterium]|nr:alpha/beta hydrolase [Legionellaceae bacterium]
MNSKIMNDRLSMILPDGRQLGYAEYGIHDGKPIFYFHGTPGSRLEAGHLQNIAILNHYRLIGIDRPGMGLSSFHVKHNILSWADDVEMFANCLGINKFSIVGHSGGAPFVAACAYKIPHRLYGAAIVSGPAPFEIPEATASLARGQRFINGAVRAMPWIATGMMKLTLMMFKKPWMLKQALKQMPEVDQCVLRSLGNNESIGAMLSESFRHGVAGAAQEFQLIARPWGFNLANIKCPVTIWQGGLDKQAPLAHAKLYTKLIPNAKFTFFKQEGHLSLLVNHGEEILRSVCEY